MTPKIIYNPLLQRKKIIRRPVFTPFAQDEPSPLVGIGKQFLDYLKTGKAITAPITPIQTEVRIPPETKKFVRTMVFTLAGAIVGGVILYQVLK